MFGFDSRGRRSESPSPARRRCRSAGGPPAHGQARKESGHAEEETTLRGMFPWTGRNGVDPPSGGCEDLRAVVRVKTRWCVVNAHLSLRYSSDKADIVVELGHAGFLFDQTHSQALRRLRTSEREA